MDPTHHHPLLLSSRPHRLQVAAASTTGSTIVFPGSPTGGERKYLMGPVTWAGLANSMVLLKAGAAIVAQPMAAWPTGAVLPALLTLDGCAGVSFTGTGVGVTGMDGQGASWWDKPAAPRPPALIAVTNSHTVLIHSFAALAAPGGFFSTQNVTNYMLEDVNMAGNATEALSAGVDMLMTAGALVRRVNVTGGGASVYVRTGSSNVTVQDSTFEGGTGAVVDNAAVASVMIRRIAISNAAGAVRMVAPAGIAGTAFNLTWENFTLASVASPINVVATSAVANATFKGIQGTQSDGVAMVVSCAAAAPCTDMYMAGITITPSVSGGPNAVNCQNAHGLTYEVTPLGCLQP